MSEAIKRRRGTTAEHAAFTGLEGELTVDTSKKVVVVHDGVTPGGVPMARGDEVDELVTTTREKITANRTYYVRTDGNDANSGLVDTATGAFLTFQRAIDVVSSLDFNGFTVTVKHGVESGTKTFTHNVKIGPLVGGGTLVVSGNGSGNTSFTSASGNTFTQELSGSTAVVYQRVTLNSAQSGIKVNYLSLGVLGEDVVFGTFGENAVWVHDNQAVFQALNVEFAIIGSMQSFLFIQYGHAFVEACTIVLVGAPAFSSAFYTAYPRGTLQYIGNTLSGAATPNGKRFSISHQSICNLAGSGENVLPGNAPGTADGTSIVI